ncbi:carbohydrate ABC transporter permease [Paenibacillus sp. HB172176]|uniref:carbohydrate ABC transporter permease n=1 Tax=Paenibacillus sp. HB172176 TaxID=2493690 RepID=UPI00143A7FC5|nr:carbohydrate ABC transporter permease [Paenibacillus sp. HB172176]
MKQNRIIEKNERSLKWVSYSVTIGFIIIGILPLVWLFITSIMDNQSIESTTPQFIPRIPHTITLTLDYSGMEEQDQAYYEKDAMKATWYPWMKFMRENIGEIKITGIRDGRRLYTSKTTSAEFYVGQPSIVPTLVFNDTIMSNKMSSIHDRNLSDFHWYDGFDNEAWVHSEGADAISDMTLSQDLAKFYSERDDVIEGKVVQLQQSKNWLRLFDTYKSLNYLAGEYTGKLGFYLYFISSGFICAMVICWQLIFGGMGSYALSHLVRNRKLKFPLLMFFLATMMIPGVTVLIPQYLLMQKLHLVDSLWAIILPHCAWGFVILLFKGFFDQLPKELLQAARIDGASEFRTFMQVVIPMSVPVFTIVAVLTFMPVWNDFMWPYIVINSPAKWTFTVAMNNLQNGANSRPNWISASGIISMIPMLIVFIGTQKYIERGINFSGVKG